MLTRFGKYKKYLNEATSNLLNYFKQNDFKIFPKAKLNIFLKFLPTIVELGVGTSLIWLGRCKLGFSGGRIV